MAEDFGSYLKSERELRGVTLDELYSKTKIPVRHLQALENNQFDELPEEVFIRGYIRSVAKVIGAQEDEVLSTYMDIKKTAPSIDTNNPSTLNQKHSMLDPKFIFVLSLTVLFLSGVVWSINTLIHKFNKDSTESIPTLSQQKQNKTKEEPAKNLPATVNKEDPEEKLNTSEASTSYTESNMPLKLTIRVKGDVWFNIMVDDSPVESFVLTRGSEKIFYGKKQYLINAGNKNLIDLTLNGTAINFPNGNKEDIVTNFTINSQLGE